MRLLLDTHILLWSLFEPQRLTVAEKEMFLHPSALCFVSIASLWEAEIKRNLGKLPIPADFIERIKETTLQILPVSAEHLVALQQIETTHRDPFDRLLAAQAWHEQMTLVTRDEALKKLGG